MLCLYVVEPGLWAERDAANQHYQFLLESLRDLYSELKRCGGKLHLVSGEVPAILDRLYAHAPFSALYSHEETGNDFSFRRDLAVARWCREHGVIWHEFAQFGVVRQLKNRDSWQANWNAHVAAPLFPLPDTLEFSPATVAGAFATGASSAGGVALVCRCCKAFLPSAARSIAAVSPHRCRHQPPVPACRPTSPLAA